MKENSKHLLEIINIHTKWIKYNRKKIKELEKTIAELQEEKQPREIVFGGGIDENFI